MTTAQDIRDQINAVMKSEVMKMASDPSLQVRYWRTGCLPFDVLLGGGLPAGRSVEVYGDFSTLKSYLALRAIAAVQQQGGIVGLIDTEHAFDPTWAESLGVDLDSLLLQHPANGEQAVIATEVMVRNQADLVVWDSVAATLPKAYQEAMPGEDAQPGRLAALMSKAMQRLTAANSKTCLLFINQTRLNIGVRFGSPETVPGGRALPFYASMRIQMSKAGKVTRDIEVWDTDKMAKTKETTAFKVKGTLQKSKLNKPYRETWFLFDLEHGLIDEVGFIIATGLEHGLVIKSGSRWSIPEVMDYTINGQAAFKHWLAGDAEVLTWLRAKVEEVSFPGEQQPSEPRKRRVAKKKPASSDG